MGAASAIFSQATFWEGEPSMRLLASADGHSPCVSPDGPKIAPCGRGRARASHFPLRAKDSASPIRDIFGPSSDAWSPSAALQRSLGSRLRAALVGYGSPEYVLTWKHWDMPSGPPIFAVRASARRTSDSGCTGWPTPTAGYMTGAESRESKQARGSGGINLHEAARLTGWPTPTANEFETTNIEGMLARRAKLKAQHKNGNGFGLTLGMMAASQLPGIALESSLAATANFGGLALNPATSRWLQGYLATWDEQSPGFAAWRETLAAIESAG